MRFRRFSTAEAKLGVLHVFREGGIIDFFSDALYNKILQVVPEKKTGKIKYFIYGKQSAGRKYDGK